MIRPALVLPLALALAALGAAPALAGPPGFAFLEIPTGARASAMGGAYASLANGAEAAFWNPAGLQGIHGVQASGGHTEYFEGLRRDAFALGGRLFGGGIAASVRALYSEPIPERDEIGNLIGTFGMHDLEFGLGYGRAVMPGVRLGLSAQAVRERIANDAATTWSLGFGGSWEPAALPGARAAFSVEHLGADAAYTIDGVKGMPVPLPTAVQTGVSWGHALGYGLDLREALEGRFTRGRNAVAMIGAELGIPGGAAVRMGLRVLDPATSVSFGAGYAIGGLHLDYAFVPYRLDLGDTQRLSFDAQF